MSIAISMLPFDFLTDTCLVVDSAKHYQCLYHAQAHIRANLKDFYIYDMPRVGCLI